MNEVGRPGCFHGGGEVCGGVKCSMADVCIWRRLPEEGGRGPKIPESSLQRGVMEGGVPRAR